MTRYTHPADLERDIALFQELISGERDQYRIEKRFVVPDGSIVWIDVAITLVRCVDGRPEWFYSLVEDITERKRLEEQLREAHTLDATVRMAGGIAHEFNNLLTVIGGNATLLGLELPETDPRMDLVREIGQSTQRAAHLTRQILAFSRDLPIRPCEVDLNRLVVAYGPVLQDTVGERIDLRTRLAAGLEPILADPQQLEQILHHLATNARDAMPEGGSLELETASVDVREAAQLGIVPGAYARLRFRDTGVGIEPHVLPRAFDPFFTTKEVRQGAGLGLSAVFGFVKQLGGHILLESGPAQGTTASICFPCVSGGIARGALEAPCEPHAMAWERRRSILVAEDEPAVRRLAAGALRRGGFEVLEAADGEEAVRILHSRSNGIDLVLTDVLMPRMGGLALGAYLRDRLPDLPIVFMSGYMEAIADPPPGVPVERAFIQKPFSPQALLTMVQQQLRS